MNRPAFQLADKRGINRYGWATVPMDESLAQIAIDLSGRPAFVFNVPFKGESIGAFPVELIEEFFKAFSTSGKLNLHITVPYDNNNHHTRICKSRHHQRYWQNGQR